ncbi:MAG: twin-arginine translocation signal domain-containing protein, partial [Caldilineaceae bacterium]|nr:twin-arginine translocation signal domain-containing protein [Caldilineaceae bacterium]
MARRTITRRKFMQLSAAMTAGALLAACGADDPEPAADQPAAEAPAESEAPAAESSSQYNEAPMLKAMVDAGDLPPIDDRLPVNPRIVTPIHEVGTYSESIRGFTLNETDRAAPGYIVNRGF